MHIWGCATVCIFVILGTPKVLPRKQAACSCRTSVDVHHLSIIHCIQISKMPLKLSTTSA